VIDKKKVADRILEQQGTDPGDRAWFESMVEVATETYRRSEPNNGNEDVKDAWFRCMTWIMSHLNTFLGEDVTGPQMAIALKMTMDAMVVAIAQQPPAVDGVAAGEALAQRIDAAMEGKADGGL
jgi:hypothetical protein